MAKITHNYTNELELKSLLIRIKNKRKSTEFSEHENNKINKYIKYYKNITENKYSDSSKKKKVKKKLKLKIISLSEQTQIDSKSYERFGEIILLMIKNILRKPSFSGYTYKDDFYSDAVYKILKYLDNFDHTLISEITGIEVNAFAYISQYIHNSIVYIIKTKKKDADRYNQYAAIEYMGTKTPNGFDWYVKDELIDKSLTEKNTTQEIISLSSIKSTLYDEILSIQPDMNKFDSILIYYPSTYSISFDEYNQLKPMLKGKISIIRKEND